VKEKNGSLDRIGSLEILARSQGFVKIAGVDEVGRGPLAGPVAAAAVILPADHSIEGLNDSKKLSHRRRQQLAEQICRLAEGWGLGLVGPRRIDQVNIRVASLEAMSIALEQVLLDGCIPDLVFTDGRDQFPLPQGAPPIEQRAVIKADSLSEAVAAASIVAKVYRDALMQEYHAHWPQYGFDKHKGYPTKFHKQAIVEHGPCEIHRLSFSGVKP